MRYYPTLEEFVHLAQHASLVPVYRQLMGDTLTPVTAFRKIEDGDWSFLFESVIGGERLGRYSFVGSGPFLIFQAWDRRVRIEGPLAGRASDGRPNPSLAPPANEIHHDDPLKLLE